MSAGGFGAFADVAARFAAFVVSAWGVGEEWGARDDVVKDGVGTVRLASAWVECGAPVLFGVGSVVR